MREGQPIRQLTGRLVRCLPIKGHHCGWNTGAAPELGPPSAAGGKGLNFVHAPADSLFEVVDRHGCVVN